MQTTKTFFIVKKIGRTVDSGVLHETRRQVDDIAEHRVLAACATRAHHAAEGDAWPWWLVDMS
jgi:hypothetical protein